MNVPLLYHVRTFATFLCPLDGVTFRYPIPPGLARYIRDLTAAAVVFSFYRRPVSAISGLPLKNEQKPPDPAFRQVSFQDWEPIERGRWAAAPCIKFDPEGELNSVPPLAFMTFAQK